MKKTLILFGLVLAMAVMVPHRTLAAASPAPIDLKSAAHFTILAGSAMTFAAPVNSTTNSGDIGTYPTPTLTGLGNLVLQGVNHAGDTVTQTAKIDLVTAYLDAEGRAPTTSYPPIFDLGGLTLTPGVYNDSTSLGITGTLTLDAQGNSQGVWVFQAGTTLITASASNVVLTNGAQARNVFWQVGSSATLGTYSVFRGTLMAQTDITLTTGSIMMGGRALAQNGAATFDSNQISLPTPEAPQFTFISRTHSNFATVSLSTTPFFLLTLKACPDLLFTNWTTITSDIPGTRLWTYTDTTATADVTNRFYQAFITAY
jgi:type VI secretion system secreted protein VgrG